MTELDALNFPACDGCPASSDIEKTFSAANKVLINLGNATIVAINGPYTALREAGELNDDIEKAYYEIIDTHIALCSALEYRERVVNARRCNTKATTKDHCPKLIALRETDTGYVNKLLEVYNNATEKFFELVPIDPEPQEPNSY